MPLAEGYEDNNYFEYWMLDSGTDDEKTRIVKVTKENKYLNFHRDDGKICRYDLSTSKVIGFRGKEVKSLSSQLKDLTTKRLIKITDDPVYKEFLNFVYDHSPRSKHRAHVFVSWALPDFLHYEQFFASGFKNFHYPFYHSYNEVPKGLIKFCNTANVELNNDLFDAYLLNPDAYNLLLNIKLNNYDINEMVDAMMFKAYKKTNDGMNVNPNDLTARNGLDLPPRQINYGNCDPYFSRLVNNNGYNAKLLITYIDKMNLKQKRRTICRDLFDYYDMAHRIHDDFDRYPSDLLKAHKRAVKEYNQMKFTYDEEKYSKRNILEYECEIDGFRFIYPRTTKEIQEEGKNQENCVSTYINRVLGENCHIMFMRPVDDLDHSYITLEIRNNHIVQAARKYNKCVSEDERRVIEKWNQKYKDFELK